MKQYYGAVNVASQHLEVNVPPNAVAINKDRFEDSSFYNNSFFTTRNSLTTDNGDNKKANKLYEQQECKQNKDTMNNDPNVHIYNQQDASENSASCPSQKLEVT